MDEYWGPPIPIQVHVSPRDMVYTPREDPLSDIVDYLEDTGRVVAFGFNCVSPELTVNIPQTFMSEGYKNSLAILPNSGNGPLAEMVRPEAFAALLKAAVSQTHAWIIGGCCGTTPKHTKSMAAQFPLVNSQN